MRAKPEKASALSTPAAAVLQADRMTQSASSLRAAFSDAERYPSSVSVALWLGVAADLAGECTVGCEVDHAIL